MKAHKKRTFQWLPWVLGFAAIFAAIIFVDKQKTKKGQTLSEITWKQQSLPHVTGADVLGETLGRLEQLFVFVSHEIKNDPNLLRLINQERSVALTRDQLDTDLKKLKGMDLGYIGQFHEASDVNEDLIKKIQAQIAQMVRSKYDVMWSEDFTGGGVVKFEEIWKEIVTEVAESAIPAYQKHNDPESTKAYVKTAVPMYASWQILSDSRSVIEVRGADYRPIKLIQQNFMGYDLPVHIRGSVPYKLTTDQKALIMRTLSDVRDLYILRHIALYADRTKRNVLVLGAYHTNHIARLLAEYGARCTIMVPQEG